MIPVVVTGKIHLVPRLLVFRLEDRMGRVEELNENRWQPAPLQSSSRPWDGSTVSNMQSSNKKPADHNHQDGVQSKGQSRDQDPLAELDLALSSPLLNDATTAEAQAELLGDKRFPAVQRQALAGRLGRVHGNAKLASTIQLLRDRQFRESVEAGTTTSDLLVQRQEDPPGYPVSEPFGDYWVVPDDTSVSYNIGVEQITDSEYIALQEDWTALKAGTGNIKIIETDKNNNDHAGFKDKLLAQFGKLMSKPTGRQLVRDLVRGSKTITIQPSATRLIALTTPGSEAGMKDPTKGSDSTIELDDDLKDESVKAYDKDGNEIASPVFTILGHELIHAKHIAKGTVDLSAAGDPFAYPHKEEETTIEGEDLSENRLRSEHELTERSGHAAKDTR